MQAKVRKEDARKLIGKFIYALRKDGTVVSGKLVRISGNRLLVKKAEGNKAVTTAFIPLVLFDLLAIETSPFAFGGFGPDFGFGGFGPGFW